MGHHSIELCVHLGIDRRVVQQGLPAQRHWRIKPFLEEHSQCSATSVMGLNIQLELDF